MPFTREERELLDSRFAMTNQKLDSIVFSLDELRKEFKEQRTSVSDMQMKWAMRSELCPNAQRMRDMEKTLEPVRVIAKYPKIATTGIVGTILMALLGFAAVLVAAAAKLAGH